MKPPRITLARVVVMIVVMGLLTVVDGQLFGTYNYYNPSGLARFVLATLISTCAVMLYERKLQ